MYEVHQRLGIQCSESVDGEIKLTHEQRDKGRLRTHTTTGIEVRIFLDRGDPLLVGECLLSECGRVLKVCGAEEPVLTARCDNWLTFSRACYHLGNRHVKIQLGELWLRIEPDHVLETMLQRLGMSTMTESAVFIPETGAYHRHGANDTHTH